MPHHDTLHASNTSERCASASDLQLLIGGPFTRPVPGSLRSGRYDARKVDAWAVGVMTSLLITGTYPFEDPEFRNNPIQTVKRIRRVLDEALRVALCLTTAVITSLPILPSLQFADVRWHAYRVDQSMIATPMPCNMA